MVTTPYYSNPGYLLREIAVPSSLIQVTGSITLDSQKRLTLVNDSVTPGDSMYYGTNSSGVKGWYSASAGSITTWGTIIGTLSSQTDLSSALTSKQPLDTDLTVISALTPSNDDILQYKIGAWANRTLTQFKVDLSLSGTNTGDQTTITGNAGTATILQTGRTIGITGDVTWTSPTFNGSGNVTATSVVTKINGTTLSNLATGILKNTTTTGVPSIAVNSDLPVMSATVGGAVPTPPNNTTTFLRGDGVFTPINTSALQTPAISTVTGGTTLTIIGIEQTVFADTTSGGFTTVLPTAVGNSGYKFHLKKLVSANTWIIGTTSSQLIDSTTTATITTQYASISVQSDNVAWQII